MKKVEVRPISVGRRTWLTLWSGDPISLVLGIEHEERVMRPEFGTEGGPDLSYQVDRDFFLGKLPEAVSRHRRLR